MSLLLKGAGPNSGTAIGPPTAAPVLTAYAAPTSNIAQLSWTPSNRTDTPGFFYSVQYSADGVTYSEIEQTTSLATTYDLTSISPGTGYFKIIPTNDEGEGPSSNAASVTVPGESSEGGIYFRPDGSSRYFRPDGLSLYLRPAA